MCCPFPVIQPPTVLPKHSMYVVPLPPAALPFTQSPSSSSAPQREQGMLLCLLEKPFVHLWIVQLHHCQGYNQARQ